MRLRFSEPDAAEPGIARTVVTPAGTWQRPPPRLAADLSGRDTDLAALLAGTQPRHAVTSDVLSDARLVWSDCFVLPDGLFQSYFTDANKYYAWALAVRDAGSLAQQTAGITNEGSEFFIDDAKFADPAEVDAPVMFATPQEPHNWGLFLLNSVPAIAHFMANRDTLSKLFVYCHHPNMRALALLLGIAVDDIVAHDVFRSYRFREIHLLRQSKMDFFVDETSRDVFAGLASRAMARHSGRLAPRIFISRIGRSREPDAPRGLIDEAALATALAALGFITFEPEALPSIGQIQLFAQAEMIVGLSGAGMFNTVFCRPGTRVVCIESMPVFLDRHANLFASLGLDYSMVLGREDDDDPRLLHRRFRIDLDAALRHIRTFLEL